MARYQDYVIKYVVRLGESWRVCAKAEGFLRGQGPTYVLDPLANNLRARRSAVRKELLH